MALNFVGFRTILYTFFTLHFFPQRKYAALVPAQMRNDPALVNRILDLAIERSKQSSPRPTTTTSTTTTTTERSPKRLPTINAVNDAELKAAQADLQSYNNDLRLLSTLLGRPISANEIPKLVKQVTSTTTTTTTVLPILQNLKPSGISQTLDIPSDEFYGKTNEALLATILKQRGIGPASNNIPGTIISPEVYGHSTTPPTTRRPIYRTTTRAPRPIIDGLAWLWKTWQETAPSPKPNPPPINSYSSNRLNGVRSIPSPSQTYRRPEPLTQRPTEFEMDIPEQPPSVPGGQVLTAVLGVTKAVSQFLGAAIQVK